MKLKYDNYLLDKTVPEYLSATLVSLVLHSVGVNSMLWEARTFVSSVRLTQFEISITFIDGSTKTLLLKEPTPYWYKDGIVPNFGYPHIKPKHYLNRLRQEVIDVLYVED
jgi:hypothetical protein